MATGDHLFDNPPEGVIEDYVRIMLSRAVAGAVQGATRRTGKHLAELAEVLLARASVNERRRLHQAIGRAAQDSVKRSYDQTVTRRKRVGSYREGDRFAAGALRRALADPDFFRADATGIDFINRDMLDERAAHWARLNAGALPAGTGSRKRFEVRFSGLAVLSLGLDMAPSEAFAIPRGYWFDPSTGQPVAPGAAPAQFFLPGSGPRGGTSFTMTTDAEGRRRRVRMQTPKMTRGIQARNFLDAGAATIANRIGPGYDDLYRRQFDKGLAGVRPQRVKVEVSGRTVQVSL